MILLRALLRLVTFVVLVVLALAGLAVAVFSIQDGTSGLSLPKLAELAQLPALRDQTDELLNAVEASGGSPDTRCWRVRSPCSSGCCCWSQPWSHDASAPWSSSAATAAH